MSTDIAIPLDGRIALDAEPDQYKVAPAPKNHSQVPAAPRAAVKEAQDIRLRQLTAQGCIAIRGKTGATVFKFR
jgi:hypothetical protein